jgi:hypothetical protein
MIVAKGAICSSIVSESWGNAKKAEVSTAAYSFIPLTAASSPIRASQSEDRPRLPSSGAGHEAGTQDDTSR